jgi:mono/diheme cytochrome c family protein
MRRTAFVLVLLVAAVGVAAAGCGGEEKQSAAPETVEGSTPETTTTDTTETETTETTETETTETETTGTETTETETTETTPAGEGDPAAGKEVFLGTAACGGCHTLADAGTQATTGPELDKVLKGKDAAFIQESITDPNKEIAPGFQANLMPQDFGQKLSPDQLKALVDYLSQVTK